MKKIGSFIILLAFAAFVGMAVYWCAYDAATTRTTLPILLNVPYINQRADYPTGCESVSARDGFTVFGGGYLRGYVH